MRVRNKAVVLLITLVLITSTPAVLSQINSEGSLEGSANIDAQTSAEVESELNLDENINGLKVGWARIGAFFTFNSEAKARKELRIAHFELIRAKVAAENEDSVALEAALNAHDRVIEKVRQRVQNLDGESTSSELEASAFASVGLERAITVHEARIQKLKDILASEAELTEERAAEIEARIEQTEEVTAHLRQVQLSHEERIRTRMMAVNDWTEAEAKARIEAFERQENLAEIRLSIASRHVARAEEILAKLKQRVSMAEESGIEVSSSIKARIDSMEKDIANAKAYLEVGDTESALISLRSATGLKLGLMNQIKRDIRTRTDDTKGRGEIILERAQEKLRDSSSKSEVETESNTQVNSDSSDSSNSVEVRTNIELSA